MGTSAHTRSRWPYKDERYGADWGGLRKRRPAPPPPIRGGDPHHWYHYTTRELFPFVIRRWRLKSDGGRIFLTDLNPDEHSPGVIAAQLFTRRDEDAVVRVVRLLRNQVPAELITRSKTHEWVIHARVFDLPADAATKWVLPAKGWAVGKEASLATLPPL